MERKRHDHVKTSQDLDALCALEVLSLLNCEIFQSAMFKLQTIEKFHFLTRDMFSQSTSPLLATLSVPFT